MKVLGIHKLVFGLVDLEARTILADMGMTHIDNVYTMLNGSSFEFTDSGHGLLEVHWATSGGTRTSFEDNGIKHVFDPALVFTDVVVTTTQTNTFNEKNRINRQVSVQDDSNVCGVGHIAIYSLDYQATIAKFKQHGFLITDEIENKSVFLRSKQENPHHQILVMKSTDKTGFQHIALNVKDVYNVITKGLNLASKGYKTVLGPGRHVISSSTTWYFNTQLGLLELSADEDYVTSEWEPKTYDPQSSLIYEWAIEDGLDPITRRQQETKVVTTFIEQKLK